MKKIAEKIFRTLGLISMPFRYSGEWLRLIRVEKHMLHTWDKVIVCSEIDRGILLRKVPTADVNVIPNTVKLVHATGYRKQSSKVNCLFVGALFYGPNIDAIGYFCRHIWPNVRERLKNQCTLTIVGRRPADDVYKYAKEAGALLFADVPDLAPHYATADIVIAPIRYGGGTRIKILEAMSYTRPVVTTTIGVEGIAARNREHLRIGDSPLEFANAVVELANDEQECRLLAENGYRLVEEHYNLNGLPKKWAAILNNNVILNVSNRP